MYKELAVFCEGTAPCWVEEEDVPLLKMLNRFDDEDVEEGEEGICWVIDVDADVGWVGASSAKILMGEYGVEEDEERDDSVMFG